MKRLFLFLSIFVFVPGAMAIDFKADDYLLKYYIKVNNSDSGILFLTKKGKSFDSNYLGITKNDRVPFYSPLKKGSLVSGYHASELFFDKNGYDIYYDLNSAPKMVTADISGKLDDKLVIAEKGSGLPKKQSNIMPVVTLENILFGFLQKSINEKDIHYLFEDTSNTAFTVYFEKVESKQFSVGSSSCDCDVYHVKRTNVPGQPDIAIFEIDTTKGGVPVRLASLSGKWELTLASLVNSKKKKVFNFGKGVQNVIERNIEEKIDDFEKVDFVYDPSNSDSYKYTFSLKKKLKNKDYEKEAKATFARSAGVSPRDASTDNIKENKTGFQVSITSKDVCKALKKNAKSGQEYGDDCKTISYTKKDRFRGNKFISKIRDKYRKCKRLEFVSSIIGGSKLMCRASRREETDRDEEIEIEDALKIYYKVSNLTLGKIEDIDIKSRDTGMEKDSYDIIVEKAVKKKVNPNGERYKKLVKRLLVAEIMDEPLKKVRRSAGAKLRPVKRGNMYYVNVDKAGLKEKVCSKMINSLNSSFTGGVKGELCSIEGFYELGLNEMNKKVKKNFLNKYPDLKYDKVDINVNKNLYSHKVEFEYADGFVEGLDACLK